MGRGEKSLLRDPGPELRLVMEKETIKDNQCEDYRWDEKKSVARVSRTVSILRQGVGLGMGLTGMGRGY